MKTTDEKSAKGQPGPAQKRLMQRAKSIRAQLGRPTDLSDQFPYKPKHMNWQTYWKVFAEGTEAERSLSSFLHKPKLRQTSRTKWKRKDIPNDFFDFAKSSEAKEVIKGLKVPDRVKKLLASVDNIAKTKGILLLEDPADLAVIFMIASHKNAKRIKEIRQRSWTKVNLDQIRSRYSRNIAEFSRIFCIEVPDFILELNHYHECMRALGRKSAAYEEFDNFKFGSLGAGIFKNVFTSRKPVEKDALSNRYGDASLNFFPLFDHGSDRVQNGLIFDYCDNAFSPSIGYMGDGDFVAEKGIWDCVLDDFELETPDSCLEGEGIAFKELDEVLEAEELGYQLIPWFYNLATTGYLNFHNKPSISVDVAARLRYGWGWDAGTEKLRTSAMRNGILFLDTEDGIYPRFPIRIEGNFNEEFSPEILSSLLGVFNLTFFFSSMIRFLDEAQTENASALRLMGLGTLMDRTSQESQSRKEILKDIQVFLNAIENFCNNEIKAGRPYLALLVGLHAWECMNQQTTELSANLLKDLPDAICHPLIKTVAKLHSQTRFDERIHV